MERGFLSLVGTKPALHGGGALRGGAFAETAGARRRQQRPRGAAALGALRRGRAAPQGVLAVPKLFGTAPLLQGGGRRGLGVAEGERRARASSTVRWVMTLS